MQTQTRHLSDSELRPLLEVIPFSLEGQVLQICYQNLVFPGYTYIRAKYQWRMAVAFVT